MENYREQALAAVERIRARRKGVNLRGLKIKDLIEEGRDDRDTHVDDRATDDDA